MKRALFLILMLPALAGCLDGDPADDVAVEGPRKIPANVQVFGTVEDVTGLDVLGATAGTYYAIGASTFEPTIGATSSGALFMTNYRGAGSGTHIFRSMDQGQTWEDTTPLLPTGLKAVPNSNDPYMYVDPWTDRVIDFDMCLILSGFCMSYSDDDGETWTFQNIATGEQPALDHQSIVAAPVAEGTPTVGYPNALVFCVNRGTSTTGAWCSTSLDGGISWTPLMPGFPPETMQCSGLHAHLSSGSDGAIYRGQPSCDGPAVYRSLDAGFTWTEHTITTGAMQPGSHEVATAVDDAGNVHAFWIGDDGLPYLASSTDQAETWSEPRMVAAEGVSAAGFPTIAAGADGKVAFAYIGTDVDGGYDASPDDMAWTGYVGVALDATNASFAVATATVNAPDDPLDEGRACGAMRCGGFGDFIDITIDADGRPWAALAHNGHDGAGIVGTLVGGPSLREDGALAPLPAGGADVWG